MKICAANWKMNHGPEDAQTFFQRFVGMGPPSASVKILFFVPAFDFYIAQKFLAGSAMNYGPQNIYSKTSGAFTGENSPAVAQSMGATHTLVGHSERRQIFKESHEELAAKVKISQDLGLTPLFCIGETLEEREKGKTNAVLKEQLEKGLQSLDKGKPFLLAYEPVWAIGTGKVASPAMAEEAHLFVHQWLQAKGLSSPILYGGSVKPDNAAELIAQPHIDGFLVGGASLEAKSFYDLCKSCKK